MKKNIIAIILLIISAVMFIQCNPIASDQKELESLVNTFRSNKSLEPVYLDNALNNAAKRHTMDMLKNDFLDHVGSDDSTFDERIRDAGYDGSPVMENAAYNYSGTAESFFNQWEASPGHNANMSNDYMNEIGFYFACNDAGKCYATMVGGKSND